MICLLFVFCATNDDRVEFERRRQHNVPTIRHQRHSTASAAATEHPRWAEDAELRHDLCLSGSGRSRQHSVGDNLVRRHIISKNSSALYLASRGKNGGFQLCGYSIQRLLTGQHFTECQNDLPIYHRRNLRGIGGTRTPHFLEWGVPYPHFLGVW